MARGQREGEGRGQPETTMVERDRQWTGRQTLEGRHRH